MKELLGKTVKEVYISDCSRQLKFVTDEYTDIYYSAYGDCCSQSYFEEINGFHALIGNKVNKVTSSDLPGNNAPLHENDDIKNYSETLVTDKGYTDFIYRNYSNGYYGGSCDYQKEEPYTQSGKGKTPVKWIQVTEDYPR